MNVLKVYRSLNGEQKQILADKKVELSRPVGELLALLKPIAGCDRVADKARTPLGCTFAFMIVALIALIVVWANVGGIFMIVPIVVAAALLVGSAMLFFWTKKIDVSNNLREFVLPVLTVFREDIAPDQPVRVSLDLRSPTSPEKRTSEGEPYKAGVYYKVVDSQYRDEWMNAEAVLVDGTRLRWSIADDIRERKKTKKNPRGKIKTKTKYRKNTEIEIEVGMKKKTYAVAAPEDADVKSGEKRDAIRMVRRVRTDSLDPVVPRALIDAVADVYRNARPAKKEA